MHDHLSSALNEKIEILTLVQDDETGNIAWAPDRKRWASVELNTSQRTIFSDVGIGARGATVVIRHDPKLTLHQAFRWNNQFLFLTSVILNQSRDRQEIKAAICEPVTLTAKPQARTGRNTMNRPVVEKQGEFTFPGILTELYHRNESDEVYRSETLQRVLVTPKAIKLRVADLVQIGDEKPYVVRQVMDLDPYKNEYSIERKEDV